MASSSYNGNFEFADSDAEPQLKAITKQLQSSRTLSNNTLIKALKEVAQIVEGATPDVAFQNAGRPLCQELATEKYCRHKNKDVRALCGFIFGQMARLFVPNSPFEHDQLRCVFEAILFLLGSLKRLTEPHFQRALLTLKSMAEVSFCLLLLDIESSDLLLESIRTLLHVTNVENYDSVHEWVSQVILCLLEEMHDIPDALTKLLMKPIADTSKFPAASKVVANVLRSEKMGVHIRSFAVGLISTWLPKDQGKSEECHKILSKLCEICPTLSLTVLPHLQELLHDTQESKRLKSLEVVGRFLTQRDSSSLSLDEYSTLLKEFMDRVVDIKESVRSFAVSAIPEILNQLQEPDLTQRLFRSCFDRLLDPDDKVRCKAVTSCCQLFTTQSHAFSTNSLDAIFMRLKDKKPSVRKCVTESILAAFQWICQERNDLQSAFIERMGHLFEATASLVEIRIVFFTVVAQNGLFPRSLHSKEAAQILSQMYLHFNEKQKKAFQKVLEYKYSLQVSISEFVSACLTGGDSRDAALVQILSYLPESEKSRLHFQKLLEHKDKAILKHFVAACGIQSTESVWKEGKKQIQSYLGSRTTAAEFFKNLCFQASPSLLSEDLVEALISISDRVLIQKLTKVCGGLFLKLLPRLAERLETETQPEAIELVLKGTAAAGKLYHLIQPTEQETAVSHKITDHLKRVIKSEYGTPKCAKYSVYTLHSLLPPEASTQCLREICGYFCEKMRLDGFVADSLSAFAIQAVATLGQISPSLLEPHAELFAQFASATYLQSSVGVPISLGVHLAPSQTSGEVESQVLLKSTVFKAIARACSPSPFKQISEMDSPGKQKLAESCLGVIASLDLLNPDSSSLHRLGGVFERQALCLSYEQLEELDRNKGHMRLSAVTAVLKINRYCKTEYDNQLYRDVAFTVQDSSPLVRSAVIQKLTEQMSYVLKMGQLHRCHKYAACLVLAAIDPVESHQMRAQDHLKTVVAIQRRNLRNASAMSGATEPHLLHALPEFMLPYLIHLLAHHDDFPDVSCVQEEGAEVYDPFQEMLLFLIEPLLTVEVTSLGENIPVMKHLLQCIKFSHDAENPEFDSRIYIVCDVALQLLKEICEGADESLQLNWDKPFPGSVSLPKALYKVDRRLTQVNVMGSHLPSQLKCISTEILKKKRPRTQPRRSSVVPETTMGETPRLALTQRPCETPHAVSRFTTLADAEASVKRQKKRTHCEIEEEDTPSQPTFEPPNRPRRDQT